MVVSPEAINEEKTVESNIIQEKTGSFDFACNQ